ncbi:MAG: ABC transporter substrate-binding protein [Chloroflexi bacterium]|nr:ABC transporter substrate-binding protein [Chloroflexota bacterium]
MKKLVVALAMVVLVAGVLGASACAAPTAAGEVKIGTVLPMTGMFTGFGEGNGFGMQAAVDDINAQGGLDVGGKKMKVKLIVLDSESDPAKVSGLAEDLMAREKIVFYAAPDCPAPMWATAAIVGEKYKVPSLIGGGPMEPWAGMRTEATPPWEYNWLTGFAIATPPDKGDFRDKPGYTIKDTWFEFLDSFSAQTNRVAGVFATDEPDGRGWYSLFPGLLKEHGEKVIGMEKNLGLVPLETTDFSSVIKEWQDNKVEILWGNCPGPVFGAMWKQAVGMGFKPKICLMGRAPLFYVDASSWGGDLAYGVGCEVWWSPEFTNCPGIGNTTPKSLAERWATEKKQPLNPGIGHGYECMQIALEAIKTAGSLDTAKINAAIPTLDMPSINSRVKFNKDHFSRIPLFVGQWFKVDKPEKWELKIVLSKHDFLPAQAAPIFPLP